MKFLLERFRLNRNTIGCHSQTQKLERYAPVINSQGEYIRAIFLFFASKNRNRVLQLSSLKNKPKELLWLKLRGKGAIKSLVNCL